jgi:hypothetical protein
MEADLIEYFDFPIPIDFHVFRVSIANELIRVDGTGENENVMSDELKEKARKLYLDYAVEHKINVTQLCSAVWLWSKVLCKQQPGNVTIEPEGRKNRKGRKTRLEPLPISLASESQMAAYHKSCGSCVLESTCKWNIPSANYYISGDLIRRGERQKFPVVMELDFEG